LDKYNKIERNLKNHSVFSTFYLILVSLILLPVFALIIEYLLNFSINLIIPEFSYFLMIAFLSPLIEEGGKITAYEIYSKRGNFQNNILSIALIGFLFGLTENLLFYFGAGSDFTTAEIIHRVLNGEILHSIAPVFYITGKNSTRSKPLSFMLPVTVHAVWNLLIYFELNTIFIYLFSLLLIIYLIIKIKRT